MPFWDGGMIKHLDTFINSLSKKFIESNSVNILKYAY